MRAITFLALFILLFGFASLPVNAQTITATLEGTVTDPTGAVVPGATVTAKNVETGLTRTVTTDAQGNYRIPLLPVGEYEVAVVMSGFKRARQNIRLRIAQTADLDFSLQVGQRAEEVVVEARGVLREPTRTTVAHVTEEQQVENLPVSGRRFVDFSLLSPGVTIGTTTAGSTDVIVEPVTNLSFGGQNQRTNFVAVDGSDHISSSSAVQKTTPSQAAVREFQVINSTYSTEYGRAVGGILNIVTKSGSNEFHGSFYEFFQNDALQARSILERPGLRRFQQNQFGFTFGGPLVRNQTFFFTNYEVQRQDESPFYNDALFNNIDRINAAKISFGLRPENLNVIRTRDFDNVLVRLDHQISSDHQVFGRYFFNDGRLTNLSPLNDGFDAPSTFRDNFLRDQSLVVNLNSTFAPTTFNELRGQFSRRSFDFPATNTEPHLEITNIFTTGVNRGNPDFYRDTRFELVDTVTWTKGTHEISFGGSFLFARSEESFPLFAPFEAQFASVDDYINGSPFVIFFETFPEGTTELIGETGLDTSIYQLNGFPEDIRLQASTEVDHTYNGVFFQDKWRVTPNFIFNYGIRYDWETWPSRWLDDEVNNFDPRIGIAYNVGTAANMVIRAGFGIFHGIVPSPLILCQEPSCAAGGGKFPGREEIQNDLDSRTGLFAFASAPSAMQAAFTDLLQNGNFPTGATGFLGRAVIVRFIEDHQKPYAIQTNLTLELEPVENVVLNATYLRVKGIHLGSFFNINQPLEPTGTLPNGNADFCAFRLSFSPGGCVLPGLRDPQFGVFFEATDRWRSVFDGLLLNARRRLGEYFGFDISYTWSKTIDDGPNPSFVLIPQNSQRLDQERAVSSDHVEHRFVANGTVASPQAAHPVLRNWLFSTIITVQSPHFFTKFAGFDANGDAFGVNDRIEGRNTFKGDSLRSVDIRLSRSFYFGERTKLELMGEVFNTFNTLNIRFFNTVCGDFVEGPSGCPNPAFNTPRAISNPRQVQFAFRLSF